MNSLEVSDREAGAVAVAPRVSLDDIKAAIAARWDTTGDSAVCELGGSIDHLTALSRFSICILMMQNGFVVIGKSAPASPENFDRELGKKLAYEDCIRQLWPLMGFALRDKLAGITPG